MKKYLKIIGIGFVSLIALYYLLLFVEAVFISKMGGGICNPICNGFRIPIANVCIGKKVYADGCYVDPLKRITTKKLLERPYFELGEKHIISSKEITESGGEIVVRETGTELDGIKIVIPTGAVNRKTKFSIGYYDNEKELSNGSDLSTVLIVKTDKQDRFNQPVEIHHDGLGYYVYNVNINNSKGTLEPLTSLSVNEVILFRPQNNIVWVLDD